MEVNFLDKEKNLFELSCECNEEFLTFGRRFFFFFGPFISIFSEGFKILTKAKEQKFRFSLEPEFLSYLYW